MSIIINKNLSKHSGSLYLSLKPRSKTLKFKTKRSVKDLINAKCEVTLNFSLKLKSETKLTLKLKLQIQV